MNRIKTYRMIRALLGCILLTLTFPLAFAQDSNSFAERVKSLDHHDGFFDLYWDKKEGKLLLQVDRFGEEFIYQSSMPRGVGSNDLGLDRGFRQRRRPRADRGCAAHLNFFVGYRKALFHARTFYRPRGCAVFGRR